MSVYDPRKTYIPILKAKTGELSALSELKAETKKVIIPLLEIPRPQWDFVNEEPLETPTQLIKRIVPYIKKYWDSNPFYLDIYGNPFVEQGETDTALAGVLATGLQDEDLNFIPVISFDYSLAYNKRIVKNFSSAGRGFALRVTFNPDELLEKGDYDILLKEIGLKPADIDLILDLGSVYGDSAEVVYLASRLVLAETPYITDWRNLAMASSSFPKAIGNSVAPNGVKEFERSEWTGWNKLAGLKKLPRLPIFSDYSVAHPEVFDDIDPRHMKLSGSIRYTTDQHWLIIKGERLTGKGARGYPQFHDLSKRLLENNHYRGSDASAGDDYIFKCAHPEDAAVTTGNLTTWRKIGNNQHFEYVIQQLAKLFENA